MVVKAATTPWLKQFPAGTREEIRTSLSQILDQAGLPADPHARVFIKPNFNNDLNSLTGNSTDLRLLWELCTELQNRGYNNIVVGDGPNSGAFKAGLDVLHRLGVRQMCKILGIECIDLNHCEFELFRANSMVEACIAKPILESDYIISMPKIKTHVDTIFSCCVKNWMGINVGQSKWRMHVALYENIIHNVSIRPPDLCIVDGIIAMEGDGPGDGDPKWLGTLIVGNDAFYTDSVIAESIGLRPESIPYLSNYVKKHTKGISEGLKNLSLPKFQPASKRSLLTRMLTSSWLGWLRFLIRPLTKLPATMQLFYHCGIVQDVYDPSEATDHIYIKHDISDDFMTHWCPSRWKEIRATAKSKNDIIDVFSSKYCIRCNYCLWADTSNKIQADINSRYLKRHIKRYKGQIESMCHPVPS